MKRIPKLYFFIVAMLILAFSYTAFFGVHYYVGDNEQTVIKGIGDIRWGTDIRGGVEATFEPAGDIDATDSELESAKAIIETRMVSSGITDYELYADTQNDRIIVRYPWKSDETEFDANTAIEEISATANLSFRASTEYSEEEEPLLEGKHIKDATVNYDQTTGKPVVVLKLTQEGQELFYEATSARVGQTISIFLDDELISNPTVDEAINSDEATITSDDFTEETATTLANQIKGGALPFALETTSSGSISATLGENSLYAMGIAAVIAFILIAIFMIIMYRLPGVIAVITLIGQMAISIAAVSGYFPVFSSFTMTLPGIAGMILSIGMGVDANVITAERIIEELRDGRTLDGALDRGTKNSLTAIIDGNMTIIIVSVILLLVFGPTNILSSIFGQSTVGSIYAFGYTLLVGVISNFIMGVALSRVMLRAVAGYKWARNKRLFGGAKDGK